MGSGGNRRLFVSGVNENCPNETLEQEFAKYGEVTDLFITRKGFAFVTMGDDDGTAAAIRELNGAFVNGQEIGVDHARPRGGGRGGGGGLAEEVADLEVAMTEMVGIVTVVDTVIDMKIAVEV